eukprot:TRINITY_DN10907_c0_g4_i1.p1 TRINITY_DN10907_c0_g4~~TRINITY_DN10907_c0_g4_i1.p1  ORF type:complete len:1019 (+),score=262.88 TRINITY_DN10907_c0_g4_i1:205-3057(+)
MALNLTEAVAEIEEDLDQRDKALMMTVTQSPTSKYGEAIRETLHLELFRLETYLACLHEDGKGGRRSPSEQRLMSALTAQTRVELTRLDLASPCAAYAVARYRDQSASFSMPGSRENSRLAPEAGTPRAGSPAMGVSGSPSPRHRGSGKRTGPRPLSDRVVVELRNQGHAVLHRANCHTGLAVLQTACRKCNLDPHMYILKTTRAADGTTTNNDHLETSTDNATSTATLALNQPLPPDHERLRLCLRARGTLTLTRRSNTGMFGLRLGSRTDLLQAAEGNVHLQATLDTCLLDETLIYVTHVEEGSNAAMKGVEQGDAVLKICNTLVKCEQLPGALRPLQEQLSITLETLSLRRTSDSSTTIATPVARHLDRLIDQHAVPAPDLPPPESGNVSIERLMVPPPPSSNRRIAPVPMPKLKDQSASAVLAASPSHSGLSFVRNVTNYVRSADEVSSLIKQLSVEDQGNPNNMASSPMLPRKAGSIADGSSTDPAATAQAEAIQRDVMSQLVAKRLRKRQKLRATVNELMATERSYVADLHLIQSRYIAPLMREQVLTREEKALVLGNLTQITRFQDDLLARLEDACGDFELDPVDDADAALLTADPTVEQVAVAVAQVFRDCCEGFKVYAQYCSGHARAVQVVSDPTRTDLHALLDARNPRQEQSMSFSSYLIKPVQRVLKYPLLLREMSSHLEHDKTAQQAVKASLGDLTRLASHINDMTKLTEMFEAELMAADAKMVLSQMFHSLLYHGSMTWCNCLDDRMKPRRQVPVYLFVFRHVIIMFEHINGDKKPKRGNMAKLFTLPKYRYLAHFDLGTVIVAGTIPADFVSVAPARLSLCWGFYHMTPPDKDADKHDKKSRQSRLRLTSVSKSDKSDRRQALRVVLPSSADTQNYDTRLYAFEMEHDAAKNECLRNVQEALLNPKGQGSNGQGNGNGQDPGLDFEAALGGAHKVY